MTLDEAIEHFRWAAENSIGETSHESEQMARWLEELRLRRRLDEEAHDAEDICQKGAATNSVS